MKKLSVLLLIALLPINAHSESATACPNIRLDAGGSMARLPVYDQGSMDTCYAYTAAQLIDAYRFSHGRERDAKPSSPLGVAVAYSALRREGNQPKPRNWISGGDFIWTINTAKAVRPGVCSDEAVTTHVSAHLNEEKNLGLLAKLWDRQQGAVKNRDSAQLAVIAEALKQLLLSRGYTEARVQRLGNLSQVMNTETKPQFLQKLLAGSCQGSEINLRELPEPAVLDVHTGVRGSSRESDFGRVLKLMFSGANPQPVGIGYCADFLKDASVIRNLEANPNSERPGSVAGCELEHASVIVGSREKNGTCEFLIRNTFGKDCSGYDRRWECENGQIWVSESALVKNTNKAGWLGGPAVR